MTLPGKKKEKYCKKNPKTYLENWEYIFEEFKGDKTQQNCITIKLENMHTNKPSSCQLKDKPDGKLRQKSN